MTNVYEGKVVDVIQVIAEDNLIHMLYNSVFEDFCERRLVDYEKWLGRLFNETIRLCEVLKLVFGEQEYENSKYTSDYAVLIIGMTEDGRVIPNYVECEEVIENLFEELKVEDQEKTRYALQIQLRMYMAEIENVLDEINEWLSYQTPFPLEEADEDNVPI